MNIYLQGIQHRLKEDTRLERDKIELNKNWLLDHLKGYGWQIPKEYAEKICVKL